MAKTKEEKQQIIKDLKDNFTLNEAVVIIGFHGVDSDSLFALRKKLKESGCSLIVAKKTLLEKVLEKMGQPETADRIREIKTQLALVFNKKDEIIPSKICHQFSKENENLKLLGAIVRKEFLSGEKVIELAKLPSREEIISRMLGTLKNPISGLVNSLKGNLNNLVYILSKIKVNQ
jgi:large subunit ribosomal protein L10